MPLAEITLDNEHEDRCLCGHAWALHSNIYGWCVLCDCQHYVQVALQEPKKGEEKHEA